MLRLLKPRLIAWIALLLVSALLIGCGSGHGSSSSVPIANIQGPWEFVAYSTGGYVTGIDVALVEGQVLVSGLEEPNGQISASSAQITFVSLDPATSDATGFGGINCLPVTSTNSLGPGSVTALGAPINFTFTQNGNVFNVTGTLSGDGSSIFNGTYTAQAGNPCTDPGGTITGTVLTKLTGSYTGTMCPPSSSSCQSSQDFTDNATATLSESSSVLTLTLALTGTDNTSFTLTGPVTGNAFIVQGTFQGQTLTYNGYAEIVGNARSLYLVNGTSSAQPNYVGTLSMP
ncbi:MAG TPA: hypothetical protein VGM18_09670 [Candidatus Sulfotelmatobacter sp.]|jgi:hypothetical protein